MPQKTGIQWTDRSSNPIRFRRKDNGKAGWHCEMLSPGCANCYSGVLNHRFGTGLDYNRHSSPLVEPYINEKELSAFLKLKGPCRVFLGDMTDLFLDLIPDAMLDRVFGAITACPRVTFQVLTKRPERAVRYFRREKMWGAAEAYRDIVYGPDSDVSLGDGLSHWPPRNVWLGVSVENADHLRRIDKLKSTGARILFLSVEPLLGPIPTLGEYLDGIDWCIVGGESGPRHKVRPCDLAWIRSIVEQCRAAGVPAFVKQVGTIPVMGEDEWRSLDPIPLLRAAHHERAPVGTVPLAFRDPKGGDIDEFPADLRVREFPTGVHS